MSLLQQRPAEPPQPDQIEPALEPEVAPARGYAAWTAALARRTGSLAVTGLRASIKVSAAEGAWTA
jgi:hypothetical protein